MCLYIRQTYKRRFITHANTCMNTTNSIIRTHNSHMNTDLIVMYKFCLHLSVSNKHMHNFCTFLWETNATLPFIKWHFRTDITDNTHLTASMRDRAPQSAITCHSLMIYVSWNRLPRSGHSVRSTCQAETSLFHLPVCDTDVTVEFLLKSFLWRLSLCEIANDISCLDILSASLSLLVFLAVRLFPSIFSSVLASHLSCHFGDKIN